MIDINKFEKLADEIISNVKKDEMKTPIQELLEHFNDAWSSPSDLWKPSKVIAKIETMLHKEEVMIKYSYWEGVRRREPDDFEVNDWYNKNFNQKNANK